MRILICIVACLVWAPQSHAGIDPDENQIGVYFDTEGTSVCATVQPNVPFYAYVILTNLSSPEVWGVEFNLCVVEETVGDSYFFRLGENWPPPFAYDLEHSELDRCSDGIRIGCYAPAIPAAGSLVVATLTYMIQGEASAELYLGPSPEQSIDDGLPAYAGIVEGGEVGIIALGVSSGDPGLPVASINGDCGVVSAEEKAFGAIKCLFR